MEHNARLIAAAPDLLEALQNAEQHIVTMLTAIAGGNTQAGARLADKDAVVIAIRAAIAKATGGAAMSLAQHARMLAATAPQPRTLAHVICEINDVSRALDRFYVSPDAPPLSDDELREWDRLDDRLDALRRELRDMFERRTGVTLDAVVAAMGGVL